MTAVPDELSEKYLQKAIAEINELGDEIGRAAGEGRVPVLGSGHPLADALEARLGEVQRFTPTIQALYVPDIDESLDDQAAKTRFWNAFKTLGPWWAELPPY